MKQGFKYIDRGKNKDALFIPGWAMDWRVFGTVEIDYNYILPVGLRGEDIVDKYIIEKKHKNIILIGWSLGGIIALNSLMRYSDIINHAFVIGVKKEYNGDELEGMKDRLEENKTRYMNWFYCKCFSNNELSHLHWFKKNLLNDYIKNIDTKSLLRGLDYLKDNAIDVKNLSAINEKITFIHGSMDLLVSMEEYSALMDYFPGSQFFKMEGASHAAFLSPDFNSIINNHE